MGTWNFQHVPDDILDASIQAANKYGISPNILLAIAQLESGFDNSATNDTSGRPSWSFPPGIGPERSIGAWQFNVLGGAGVGHSESNLRNPYYAADLAASILSANGTDDGNVAGQARRVWSTGLAAWAIAATAAEPEGTTSPGATGIPGIISNIGGAAGSAAGAVLPNIGAEIGKGLSAFITSPEFRQFEVTIVQIIISIVALMLIWAAFNQLGGG